MSAVGTTRLRQHFRLTAAKTILIGECLLNTFVTICVPSATSAPRCCCAHYITAQRLAPPAGGRDGFWGWRLWRRLWLVGLDGCIYDRHASTLCHSATDSGLQQPSCNPILMKKWSWVDGITLLQTGFADAPYRTGSKLEV